MEEISLLKFSSLHGFNYFQPRYPKFHRLLWVLIILLSFVTSCFFNWALWTRFIEAPIRLTYVSNFHLTNTIPFPAVTICTQNRAKPSNVKKVLKSLTEFPNNVTIKEIDHALEIIPHLISPYDLASFSEEDSQLLKKVEKVLVANRYDAEGIIDSLGQTCEELLVSCLWEGEERDCRELFQHSHTMIGDCCSFNYKMSRFDTSKPISSKYYGSQFGISVTLDLMTYDSSSSRSNNVQVIIHNPYDFPMIGVDAIYAKDKHETFIHVNPVEVTGSEEIQSLNQKDRPCLFDSERRLYYFRHYQEINCNVECIMNATYDRCKCLPYYLPKRRSQKECELYQYECAKLIIEEYFGTKDATSCDCKLNCNYIDYGISKTNQRLDGLEHTIDPFYLNLKESRANCVVHAYFAKQTYSSTRYVLLTSVIDLIAGMGGVYGLFLGFSFISVFELVYFGIKAMIRCIKGPPIKVFDYRE